MQNDMVDSDLAFGNTFSEHTVFTGYESITEFANIFARNHENRSTIDR